MKTVYTKFMSGGLMMALILSIFAGFVGQPAIANAQASCATTPSYISIAPSGGTVYFSSGQEFAPGTYRISYNGGFFSWDEGAHFLFYTTKYDGRGFNALFTNGSAQRVPILRMSNGQFATNYYTSEAQVKAAYQNVYYEFTVTGGKIGISFNDDNFDNHGNPVSFKLDRVSGGSCTQALIAQCSANTAQANLGDNVTYTVTATGGTSNYTYSWSGTDGLTGTGSTASRAYNTTGTKNASVVVTSGSQSTTVSCSTYVNQNGGGGSTGNLDGSCYAGQSWVNIGDSVTFYAQASGGNGNYTYYWSGTDGLYATGPTATRVYTYPGSKNASVTITSSNGQSIVRNCSTTVNNYNNNNYNNGYYYNYPYNNYNPGYNVPNYGYNGQLTGSCSVTPSTAYVGDQVVWTAINVIGGNGYNVYSWSGTDGLYGSTQSAYKVYTTPGLKTATYTVYSGGQTLSQTCNVTVLGRNGYVAPTQITGGGYGNGQGGVSLSQVPYTGVSDNIKFALFALALVIWSAVVAYIFIIRPRLRAAN